MNYIFFLYNLRINRLLFIAVRKWTCRKLHFVIFLLSKLFALCAGKFTDKSAAKQNKTKNSWEQKWLNLSFLSNQKMHVCVLFILWSPFFHKVVCVQHSGAKPTHLRQWNNLKSTSKERFQTGPCFHCTSWNSAFWYKSCDVDIKTYVLWNLLL